MVLSTDWTEFGVVPDIRGSALRDPCSGGLVFSTRGLHPGISRFTVLQSVKLVAGCMYWGKNNLSSWYNSAASLYPSRAIGT